MFAAAEISAALQELPPQTRAGLAVELIDSLGEEDWSMESLVTLADERDAMLESGTLHPMTYDQFLSGLKLSLAGA